MVLAKNNVKVVLPTTATGHNNKKSQRIAHEQTGNLTFRREFINSGFVLHDDDVSAPHPFSRGGKTKTDKFSTIISKHNAKSGSAFPIETSHPVRLDWLASVPMRCMHCWCVSCLTDDSTLLSSAPLRLQSLHKWRTVMLLYVVHFAGRSATISGNTAFLQASSDTLRSTVALDGF